MTDDLPNTDSIARFTLANEQLRGEIITLQETFTKGTAHQTLPPEAKQLLGEFMAASLLLAEILKFDGTLTLQVRGDGKIPLIMAEATSEHTVRGVAKVGEGIDSHTLAGSTFNELMGKGVLTLTIDPKKGKRYQGIVPIEGATLADCLSHYFTQSEQLPTRLWLVADVHHAAGVLLQALPDTQEAQSTPNLWATAEQLANTVKLQELTQLSHATVLYRLFHELEVTLYPSVGVAFLCGCTRERSANALTALGVDDAYALLEEQKSIAINCHFCGELYQFNKRDLDNVFEQAQKPH